MPLPLGFLMRKQFQGFQNIHVVTYLIIPRVIKTSLTLLHDGFSLSPQKIASLFLVILE
jgi:hypothetical protein